MQLHRYMLSFRINLMNVRRQQLSPLSTAGLVLRHSWVKPHSSWPLQQSCRHFVHALSGGWKQLEACPTPLVCSQLWRCFSSLLLNLYCGTNQGSHCTALLDQANSTAPRDPPEHLTLVLLPSEKPCLFKLIASLAQRAAAPPLLQRNISISIP